MTNAEQPVRTKQQLGAFYTPQDVARILTDWAITKPSDKVLDPSFGGCAFLYAALETVTAKEVANAGTQIYGIDIDPEAKSYLKPLYDAGANSKQFLERNFFEVLPGNGFEKFDCIVGNPPYVNYHNIDKAEQKLALTRLEEIGARISGRASYWAFFLLHSLRFLRNGGRMAMVLPNSFARADYAAEVKTFLSRKFSRIYIIFLQERIFQDTEEQAVFLFASGYNQFSDERNVIVREAKSRAHLSELVKTLDEERVDENRLRATDNLFCGILSSEVLDIMQKLEASPNILRLGDWVNVRIGVVTGGNRYFIISESQKHEHELPDDALSPIVTRPSQLNGLHLKKRDVTNLISLGKPSFLLSINETDSISPSVKRFIDSVPKSVTQSTKCAERDPWYCVPHRFAPPAFINYMSVDSPRITVNKSKATCTNNIHRLLWKTPRCHENWIRLALGSLSTVTQLSAEMVGRSYGTGVLKLEPREVLRLSIPIREDLDEELIKRVDGLLRTNRKQEAINVVDEYVLRATDVLTSAELQTIKTSREYLYRRRKGGTN